MPRGLPRIGPGTLALAGWSIPRPIGVKRQPRNHPKMTALLARWGVFIPQDMTAGEAADLISLELLRRTEGRPRSQTTRR